MIYVLSSRLKAQEISEDKSEKVINDVIHSLFDESFLIKINKPQRTDKLSSYKSLFEKLAHSSIMKLNETSMNKLFDLILMTMKLIVLRIRTAEELMSITNNHFLSIKDILHKHSSLESKKSVELIDYQFKFLNQLFSSFSSWDFLVLKRNLMRFFQGKNIKVSIFLNEGLQCDNGIIKLPLTDPSAINVKQPGNVCLFENGMIVKTFHVDVISSAYYNKGFESHIRESYTNLGRNIFLVDPKIKISFLNECQSSQSLKNIVNSIRQGQGQGQVQGQIQSNDEDKVSKHSQSLKNEEKLNEGESIGYLKNNERKVKVDSLKKEFNSLASILNIKIEEDENQFFELDFDKGKDWIDVYHKKDNKFINEFDNIYNQSNHCDEYEDDLLDMMDKAVMNG